MMTRLPRDRTPIGLASVFVAALLLSACGGGGDTAPADTPSVTPTTMLPTASFKMPASVAAGDPVPFDATASASPAGSPLTYGWDFGNGTRGGAATLGKTFAAAGRYTVTLTVQDNAGRSASQVQTLIVTVGPAPGPSIQVSGLIEDLANAPLAGVSVSVVNGGAVTVSDGQGHVALTLSTAVDVLLKLSKSGFADQFMPVRLPATAGADAYFEARLVERAAAQTLPDASQGGTLAGTSGAQVTFGGGSLVDASGHAVTGAVQVSMTPIDVTSTAIATFPGRFQGITAAAVTTAIVSHGTVEFVLSQNGQPVQLRPGAMATIEIPAFANADVSGTPLTVGSAVPLWSLDETTGLWTQEGSGTVVASTGSPTGLALRATVGHLSWWNMDSPIDSDFKPEPKCQDAGSGTPGSTDHLATATICNMLAQFAGARGADRNAVRGRAQIEASAAPVILPGFGGIYTIPIAGGVAIALPANLSLTLFATALNGTWVGQADVMGSATDASRPIIPMHPIAAAPAAQRITLPFDQTLALAANQSSSFTFTTDGALPVAIAFAPGTSSSFTGQARLLHGATVLAAAPFGTLVATLSSTVLPAGDYVIEIDNTGNVAASFRLQAALVHWSSQGPAMSDATFPIGALAFAYDPQGRPVVMASENYVPDPVINQQNSRLVFRRLVGTTWIDLAPPIELGHGSAASPCVGFALDHNGNPAYALLDAAGQSYSVQRWSGAAWQTVGGALTGNVCTTAPDLVFTAGNQPILAHDANAQLFVQQFDGTAWQPLGPNQGRVAPSGVYGHSMKLDSTGAPVVAWYTGGDTNAGHVAFVVRFASSPTPGWVGIGPNSGRLPTPSAPGVTFSYLQGAELVLDGSDRPLVAAGVVGFDAANLTVSGVAGFSFDGAQWVDSGFHRANASGTVADVHRSQLGALVDAAGQLLVAWTENDNSTGLHYYLQTWPRSGSAWQELGSALGQVDNPALTQYPILRVVASPAGTPAIAFAKRGGAAGVVDVGISVFVP